MGVSIEAVPGLVRDALGTLARDAERLETLSRYMSGRHDLPYVPPGDPRERKDMAAMSVTNMVHLVVNASVQALTVEGFRRSGETVLDVRDEGRVSPDWGHWQASRMDAGSKAIIRTACVYGLAYVLTEVTSRGVRSRGLSPRQAVALFEDPASDVDPVFALRRISAPSGAGPGRCEAWDDECRYVVEYRDGWQESLSAVRVVESRPHGARRCPVSRVVADLDLEGNVVGLVEPLIPIQRRLNQSVFQSLVTQADSAKQQLWATGVSREYVTVPGPDGKPIPALGADGQPIPAPIRRTPGAVMTASRPDARIGHIPAGSTREVIAGVELAQRHLAAIAQVPPHFMLGEIANVSADGLRAAAKALRDKNRLLSVQVGEGLERMFRVAAEMRGERVEDGDFGELMWADMSDVLFSQVADGLGKLAENVGVPHEALWELIPGVSSQKLAEWHQMAERQSPSIDWEATAGLFDAGPEGGE